MLAPARTDGTSWSACCGGRYSRNWAGMGAVTTARGVGPARGRRGGAGDREMGQMGEAGTGEVRLDDGNATSCSTARRATRRFGCYGVDCDRISLPRHLDEPENHDQWAGNPGNVG